MSHDPFENFKKQKADSDKMDRKNLPSDNVGNVSNYFEVPEEIKTRFLRKSKRLPQPLRRWPLLPLPPSNVLKL
jgi:hypothetical protein